MAESTGDNLKAKDDFGGFPEGDQTIEAPPPMDHEVQATDLDERTMEASPTPSAQAQGSKNT